MGKNDWVIEVKSWHKEGIVLCKFLAFPGISAKILRKEFSSVNSWHFLFSHLWSLAHMIEYRNSLQRFVWLCLYTQSLEYFGCISIHSTQSTLERIVSWLFQYTVIRELYRILYIGCISIHSPQRTLHTYSVNCGKDFPIIISSQLVTIKSQFSEDKPPINH